MFLFFVGLVDWLSGRIHQPGRYEDDQITFDVLIDIGAEQAADHRNVAEERRAVLNFLDVFAHQTAKHNCLPVPHVHTGGHFSCTEDGLIDNIIRESDCLGRRSKKGTGGKSEQRRIYGLDRTAVINEATGSTSKVTPVLRVSKFEGVDGPTTGKAMVVVVELLLPLPWMSGTLGSVNCVG